MKKHSNILIWIGIIAISFVATYYLCLLVATFRPERVNLKDVLDIGTFVVLAIGLGSLVLLAKQIRDGNRWNKLMSYHNFFAQCPPIDIRDKVIAVLKGLGESVPTHGKKITDDTAKALLTDDEKLNAVTQYLDYFESMCGAINCGLVDKSYAYGLEGGRVIRLYTVFEPFISSRQEKHPHAYVECEKLAKEWGARRQAELDRNKSNLVVPFVAPK